MSIVFLLVSVVAFILGVCLISDTIKSFKREINDKLKWIEKQNNLLREEINEVRLQLDDTWKDVKHIKRLENETRR